MLFSSMLTRKITFTTIIWQCLAFWVEMGSFWPTIPCAPYFMMRLMKDPKNYMNSTNSLKMTNGLNKSFWPSERVSLWSNLSRIISYDLFWDNSQNLAWFTILHVTIMPIKNMKQKVTNNGYKYTLYLLNRFRNFCVGPKCLDRGQKANFSSEELSFVRSKIKFTTIIWQCLAFWVGSGSFWLKTPCFMMRLLKDTKRLWIQPIC